MTTPDSGNGSTRRATGSGREPQPADLRATIDRKDQRIQSLEAELAQAREFSRLADRFVDAVAHRLRQDTPGRTRPEKDSRTEQVGDQPTETGDTGETDESDGIGDALAALADVDSSSDTTDSTPGSSDEAVASIFDGMDTLDSNGQSPPTSSASDSDSPASLTDADNLPSYVRPILTELRSFPEIARGMLRHYYHDPPASPIAAHLAAGGDGQRTAAYAMHRKLRRAGYVAHVGRGKYRARLCEQLATRTDTDRDNASVQQDAETVLGLLAEE